MSVSGSAALVVVMAVAMVGLTYGVIRAANTRPGDAPWWGPRWAVLLAATGVALVAVTAVFVASR